jgi:hypothetical protein
VFFSVLLLGKFATENGVGLLLSWDKARVGQCLAELVSRRMASVSGGNVVPIGLKTKLKLAPVSDLSSEPVDSPVIAEKSRFETALERSKQAEAKKRKKLSDKRSGQGSLGLQSIAASDGFGEREIVTRQPGSKSLELERLRARKKLPACALVEDWFRREVGAVYGQDKMSMYQRWGAGELKRASDLVCENEPDIVERMVTHFVANHAKYGFDGFPTIYGLWSCRNRVAGELCGISSSKSKVPIGASPKRRGLEDEFDAKAADKSPEIGW